MLYFPIGHILLYRKFMAVVRRFSRAPKHQTKKNRPCSRFFVHFEFVRLFCGFRLEIWPHQVTLYVLEIQEEIAQGGENWSWHPCDDLT